MIQQVPFINREKESDHIEELTDQWGTRRILCIEAEGGIGKTRLIQEMMIRIERNRERDNPLIISEIIDFDDHTLQIPINLLRRFAEILDEKTDKKIFEPYFHSLKELRSLEKFGSSERMFQKILEECDKNFIECFKKIRSRIVLFLDTTDAVKEKETNLWTYLAKIILQLENIFILITGRNAKEVGETLQKEMGENIKAIDLSPLTKEASESYLIQKQKLFYITLEPQLAENLIFMADGRPILLDLAVEWRSNEIPLDWLLEKSPEELASLPDDQKKEHQQEFERRLIHHIADTHELTDWLILLMSIIYPLDPEMLTELFNTDEKEANTLFEEAKSFVFVKQLPDKRISLHDEMRRMIIEHVWPKLDPDGDRRRDYLGHEIAALTNRIDKFKTEERTARDEGNIQAELNAAMTRETLEQERWNLKRRLLKNIPFADIDEIIKILTELFDESTKIYRFFFRQNLIPKIKECINRLSDDQTNALYELKYRLINYYRDNIEYQQARELVTEIIKKGGISPEQEVEMYIQSGNLEVRSGNLEQGISDFEIALQICKKHNFQHQLVYSLNGQGWAYRNQGDFDKALKNYRDAYQLSLQIDDDNQTALILNNMSNVNARKGRFETALNNTKTALHLWKDMGDRRGIGMAYTAHGEIHIRFDQAEKAMDSYKKALDIFKKQNDREWISNVKCGLASVFLSQREFHKAEKNLNQALEYAPENLKTRIFFYQAKAYQGSNNLNDARHKFEECRNLSQKIGDHFFDYACFSDIIELTWEFGEYHRWQEFYNEYKELYADKKSEMNLRLKGTSLRKIGDLAICNGDYENTLAMYKESFLLLAEKESLWRYTIGEQVKRTDNRIRKHAPKALLHQLGNDLTQFWKENETLITSTPESLLTFKSWIQE
ncbi:MAG: tetratricopeptide repeat protein [Desulfobacterales bacterium]|nr:tetratricopeptide repeat protein [Desulfobacterales bacterium]